VRILARTGTAFIAAGVIAAGCGVHANSHKHAAGICASVEPLLKTRRSLDALDRKTLKKVERVTTSADGLRRLSLSYRRQRIAYAELETRAKAYMARADAGQATGTIKHMWRQLADSLNERKIQMLYFANAFAKASQPRTNAAGLTALDAAAVRSWNGDHRAVIARANAQYFRMESAIDRGLTTLGFQRRGGVFDIDC
jgi:hypothetical protein